LLKQSKDYVDKVRELEFKLQDNWNLPKDINYHTYWDKLYGCECPKMDNSERFGYPKIINMSCKYHKYIKK